MIHSRGWIRVAMVGLLSTGSCGGVGGSASSGLDPDAAAPVNAGDGGSGDNTSSDRGSSDGASSDGGPSGTSSPGTVAGCGSSTLLQTSDDPSAVGPWPVGVKTVTLSMTGGDRPVEVWYPATPGSEAGQTRASYDVEAYLPNGEATKIPASANALFECSCYRDLPLDTAHGPYPAVIFIHGTGAFRTLSPSTVAQWASRGFVVVATDHAGLFLTDYLVHASKGDCTGGSGVAWGAQNLSADVDAMIAGLTNKTAGLSFLGSTVDVSRIGISGQSAGAGAAAQSSTKPNVEVVMPLANPGAAPKQTSALKSVLIIAGANDSVVPFALDKFAYTNTKAPLKRLVGFAGGDHMDVTDLCSRVNAMGENGIQVASKYGVCGASSLAALAKCGNVTPAQTGPNIVNYATTAALEETLHCQNRDAAFSALTSKYAQIGTFTHSP